MMRLLRAGGIADPQRQENEAKDSGREKGYPFSLKKQHEQEQGEIKYIACAFAS